MKRLLSAPEHARRSRWFGVISQLCLFGALSTISVAGCDSNKGGKKDNKGKSTESSEDSSDEKDDDSSSEEDDDDSSSSKKDNTKGKTDKGNKSSEDDDDDSSSSKKDDTKSSDDKTSSDDKSDDKSGSKDTGSGDTGGGDGKRDCSKIKWGKKLSSNTKLENIVPEGKNKGYVDTDGDGKVNTDKERDAGMCELHLSKKKCGYIAFAAT